MSLQSLCNVHNVSAPSIVRLQLCAWPTEEALEAVLMTVFQQAIHAIHAETMEAVPPWYTTSAGHVLCKSCSDVPRLQSFPTEAWCFHQRPLVTPTSAHTKKAVVL